MSSDAFLEDLRISTLQLHEAAELICASAGSDKAKNVFTLNLDHLVKMRVGRTFRDAYRRVEMITADGFPIVMACSLQGKRVSRVPGSDLIDPISAQMARYGKPVYLFGSSTEILGKASLLLRERHAGLKIVGVYAPPFGFDPLSGEAHRCIEEIAASGAVLCFVALGAPKQELFADHAKGLMPNISFVCIGAGLDFIAGAQVRAPRWMQRWYLEWLWRGASDPRRLLFRYFLCMIALPGILARAVLYPRHD